jgi:hypothetical protein
VRSAGRRIDGWRPDQICRAGVGRTFQLVKPFVGLSVMENVVVGALNACASVREAKEKAAQVIEQLGLAAKRDQMASSLTLPERKRLEVARALATGPRILLLDEVMAGLRPTEMDHMVALFRDHRSAHHPPYRARHARSWPCRAASSFCTWRGHRLGHSRRGTRDPPCAISARRRCDPGISRSDPLGACARVVLHETDLARAWFEGPV